MSAAGGAAKISLSVDRMAFIARLPGKPR
jgi:hypothetical protein